MVVLLNEAYVRRKRRWMAIPVHTRTSLTSPLQPRDPFPLHADDDDDDDEQKHETVETERKEEPHTNTTRLELSVQAFVVNSLLG